MTWHKNGWEVHCNKPIKEPRCTCDRCNWRVHVMAFVATHKLIGSAGEEGR